MSKTSYEPAQAEPAPADEGRGFAGMPDTSGKNTTVAGGIPVETIVRPYLEAELPVGDAPANWDRPDEDRTFGVVALSTADHRRARDLAGGAMGMNMQGVMDQMVQVSLHMIGGKRATHDVRVKWWEDIGPKWRLRVSEAFNEMNSPKEENSGSFRHSFRVRVAG